MAGCKMERRKTMTMNWDGLRDDDDDFFESNNRISCFAPQDLNSSDSDDEDFDDCRISFASAAGSAVDTSQFRALAPMPLPTPMAPDYNIWMTSPGSIRERRQRLFQGMGLTSNKQLVSFKRCVSNKPKVPNVQVITPEVPAVVVSNAPKAEHISEDASKQDSSSDQSPLSILFARSRSEGDIESLSIEKKRKEEVLGSVSKQRLTRTSSLIISTLHAKLYPYQESVKASPKDSGNSRPTIKQNAGLTTVISKTGFGAFYLIKNLDTGKEFIVNEYDQDGMWNKLSDLQTGKKLTMEEFEKSVGYSPVVKELMRRENPTAAKFNSYISKSLKLSKKKSVAMLKSIKGVANSMTLRGENPLAAMDQKNAKNNENNNNNNNQWVKVRQTGKSYKELSALHLCQEIQAHEGSIWTIKFSADTRFLASAGEDKIIHVWEVQECDVMSTTANDGGLASGNSTPIHPSLASSPIHPALAGSPIHPALASSLQPSLSLSQDVDGKKKGKGTTNKKGNVIPDYVHVPETVFLLSDKPVCSFKGHTDDVLDLSWSTSQQLLSSSMDKTVRLWDMESKSCVRLFAHNDYVTCINFNPVDEDYFISGSLDAKVRIWNIPGRKVVDWTDLHEMVTAACYTPDGQGAIIGSNNGSCRTYSTEDGKITPLEQITIQPKKVNAKKITGFQFCPMNPSQVLVTSADSRIRILDGTEVYYKITGLRNTNSQIAASFTSDGKHVISASEDSQVFVWRREEPRSTGTGKSRTVMNSRGHENFPCKDVSVAIPWPGTVKGEPPSKAIGNSKRQSKRSQPPQTNTTTCDSPTNEDNNNNKKGLPPLPKKTNNNNNKDNNVESTETPPEEDVAQISSTDTGNIGESSPSVSRSSSLRQGDSPSISAASNLNSSSSIKAGDSPSISSASNSNSSSIRCGDSPSVSSATTSSSWGTSWSWFDVGGHGNQPTDVTAWGLVIVTATLSGEIKIYQNFGMPRKIGRL